MFGLAYSLATPLGEAPDEADHYAYAAYIVQEGRLPAGSEMTQGKHPPLYYLLAAAAGHAAGGDGDRSFLRANPDMGFGAASQAGNFFVHTTVEDWPWRDGVLTMRMGRLLSIVAGLVLVAGTYLLGRTVWPGRPELAFGAATFAAFLPESLFVGGSMSNDMLAAMWSTLALWLALSARSLTRALLAGVCLGLAFVTKASTGSLALIVGTVLLVNAWPAGRLGAKALRPGILRVMLAGAAAFLIALPWLLRNWQLYGDPFGWSVVLATIDRRQGPLAVSDIAQLAKGWWLSFWGKFGGAGHIPLPQAFYVLWAVLGVLTVAGWVVWLARRRQAANLVRETSLAGWVVLLGAPLVTAAGIYSYSKTALGTDQGRLLFPALGALALLVAGGLAAWVPQRLTRAAAAAWAGGMTLVAVLALYGGLIVPFSPPPAPDPAQVAQAEPLATRFGPLELLGTAWSRPASGQPASLTLYWRAAEPVEDDLRTALRMVDNQGNLLWEWKRSPGAGRFSTDRWPVGRDVADTYVLPGDALSKAARVEVGLRPFPEAPWLLATPGGEERLSLPLR